MRVPRSAPNSGVSTIASMRPVQITVDVDRDSVAMGDDVESHRWELRVEDGTLLSAMLEAATPDIRSRGWSWVAIVNGETSAVWSVDHGVRLLVDDRRLTTDDVECEVYFQYFLQIEPEWLYQRLRAGARADRDPLVREYAPIAEEKYELELRRRERELADRLLSAECIAALEALGATVDLHADRVCRFDFQGERWTVERSDSMTIVSYPDPRGRTRASLRPAGFAECWTVAAVVARVRVARGLPRLPDVELHSSPNLRQTGNRWMTSGPITVVLTDEDAVACFRLAIGRTVPEIFGLLTG